MTRTEISEELRSVISGKTLDAVFPPLVFLLANGLFGLIRAAAIAAGFALIANNAANYYFPKIITSAGLVTLSLMSLGLKKPLAGLFLINTLLGFPVTIAVLILSYVYGIWRLKQLGGPGIDEFRAHAPKPWRGQTRGF